MAAAALSLAACGAELDRSAGALVVDVRGIPDEADEVGFVIEGDGVASFEARGPAEGATWSYRVDSVPAGRPLRVEAQATAAGVIRGSGAATAVVEAEDTAQVVIDVSAGSSTVRSGPLVLRGSATGEDTEVAATFDVAGAAWSGFLADASLQLGDDPVALELTSARIALSADEQEADDLEDAWTTQVVLRAVGPGGSPSIEVGRAAIGHEPLAVTLQLQAGASALGALTDDLLQGTVKLVASGAPPPDEDDPIQVQLDLTVEWLAR
jgi:hypothetical protein